MKTTTELLNDIYKMLKMSPNKSVTLHRCTDEIVYAWLRPNEEVEKYGKNKMGVLVAYPIAIYLNGNDIMLDAEIVSSDDAESIGSTFEHNLKHHLYGVDNIQLSRWIDEYFNELN